MKKWISIFLATIFCLALFGCGTNDKTKSPSPSTDPNASEEPTPTPTSEPVYVKIGIVHDVDSFLNIRSGPGTSYDVLGKAYSNDRFTVLNEFYAESWHQVEYHGGVAYIHADYLTVTEEQVTDEYSEDAAPSDGTEIDEESTAGAEA